MSKYKVILNYHGEIHEIYTTTIRPDLAAKNAIYKLAETLKRDLSFVQRHFWNGDKILVTKVKEEN